MHYAPSLLLFSHSKAFGRSFSSHRESTLSPMSDRDPARMLRRRRSSAESERNQTKVRANRAISLREMWVMLLRQQEREQTSQQKWERDRTRDRVNALGGAHIIRTAIVSAPADGVGSVCVCTWWETQSPPSSERMASSTLVGAEIAELRSASVALLFPWPHVWVCYNALLVRRVYFCRVPYDSEQSSSLSPCPFWLGVCNVTKLKLLRGDLKKVNFLRKAKKTQRWMYDREANCQRVWFLCVCARFFGPSKSMIHLV